MISSLIVQFVVSLSTLSYHHCDHPSAVVWGDQVFALADCGFGRYGALYRGTLKPHQKRVREPLEYWNPGGTKVDIRDNRVLFSGDWLKQHPKIVPFEQLSVLEDNDYGQRLAKCYGHNRSWDYLTNQAACDVGWLLFPPYRKPDVPAPKDIPLTPDTARTPELARSSRQFLYSRFARRDVQLAGPKTVRLFHAYKDTLFVSIEPD